MLKKRVILALLVAVTCIGCDQVSKHYAQASLKHGGAQSYLNGSIRLYYAENPGVAFSLGADLPKNVRTVLFIVGPGICLIVLLAYIVFSHRQSRISLLALGFILGGGVGNLIDRIIRDGRVVDFLNIGIGELRTATFNVADTAISTGMILLFITMFFPSLQAGEKSSTFTTPADRS